MPKRTEEQKICKAEITVVLGGVEYSIAPLVIKDSRIWREKVSEALGEVPKHLKATTADEDAWSVAMKAMLSETPDLVIELFFEYAKDLNREDIEAVATEVEIAVAFQEVAAVAFPLAGSLIGILGKKQP